MDRYSVNDQYFNWLSGIVCGERYSRQVSYNKLLMCLHDTEFTYVLPMDQNRADEGIGLRYRFALAEGYEDVADTILGYLDGPCTVLEMMVALSLHAEDIMDDFHLGNRTGQWFWGMVVNLGLGGMSDNRYDLRLVDEVLIRFLNREYEPDGRGGLFTIKNCDRDLRKVEIFHQMCWYLNSID